MTRTIDAHGDWMTGQQPFKIGTMVVDRVRGKESHSFSYDANWLTRPDSLTLDRDPKLYKGLQYPPGGKQGSFWLFLNSSPGRSDDRDVPAWEMVAHRIAVRSGLSVPESTLDPLG